MIKCAFRPSSVSAFFPKGCIFENAIEQYRSALRFLSIFDKSGDCLTMFKTSSKRIRACAFFVAAQ